MTTPHTNDDLKKEAMMEEAISSAELSTPHTNEEQLKQYRTYTQAEMEYLINISNTSSNKQLLDELSADVGENYVDNEETFVTPNGEITNKERSRFRSLLQSRRDGLEGKL